MALAKCRECSKEISTGAKRCPHCGVRIGMSGVAKFFVGIGITLAAFLLFASVVGPANYDTETVENACIQAQVSVEDRLRSPKSAEFTLCDEHSVTRYTDGSWAVVGYVDSQNAFGATIRSIYTAKLTHENGKWQTASVVIEAM